MGSRKETLCWRCENAVPNLGTRGCEWSRCFLPVPGWKALDSGECEGFLVEKCPKFRPDRRKAV